MDVARYGDYATLAYTNAKVRENYSRRFRITFPNEELPAARPLHTTPIYDRLTAANAVWGASYGLEHALWFQEPGKEPIEEVTFHRSNAWDQVAAECRAVRERVGLTEIANFAKYRVTGPGAAAWLLSLLTNRMPAIGRIVLTAMLNDSGPDRRGVHGGPRGRGRVLPVRVAGGRDPPQPLVPPPPAGGRQRAVRDARTQPGRAEPRRPARRDVLRRSPTRTSRAPPSRSWTSARSTSG